jgi:hypothetical protein
MDPNPNTRITIEEALKHPWIRGAPSHRIIQGTPPLKHVSLKKLDLFLGRDSSEIAVGADGFERSYTVRTSSIENELRAIVPPTQRSTARETAKRLILTKRVPSGTKKTRKW